MASLNQDPESKKYRIHFRYGGRQFQKSLKTTDPVEAENAKTRIELTLRDLESGRLTLPPDADFWTFVFTDGKRTQKAVAPTVVTLDQLFTRYEQEMPPGSMEPNSLNTYHLHKRHLLKHLGRKTGAQTVSLTDMQRYANQRAKTTYRGRTISPRTIKKEVATFRAVWNWGKLHGIVTGDSPTKGLRYDKEDERWPFQTREQIEKRIARGGLTDQQVSKLWETLFLRVGEVNQCLEHVRSVPGLPGFVYPMFVFVAHTGARRAEMRRSRIEDFDFEAKEVTIREKKRRRDRKETTRRVPMTPLQENVMRDWLSHHPGGAFTFCLEEVVARSRKRSPTTGHQSGKERSTTSKGRAATVRQRTDAPGPGKLTEDEANDHFKRALAGSEWAVVRGFHVFRHSFASNMALEGERQELIDELMGHETEEMRRRYRHLFPEETKDAVLKMFGSPPPAESRSAPPSGP